MSKTNIITKKPLWFGFALAPLVIPLLYAVYFLFFWSDLTPKQELSEFTSNVVQAWILIFITIIFCSYLACTIFGIPLILVLKRINRLSFRWIAPIAIPIGAMVFGVGLYLLLLFDKASNVNELWIEILNFSCVGAVLGLAVSSTFCLLVGIPARSKE